MKTYFVGLRIYYCDELDIYALNFAKILSGLPPDD